MALLLLSLHQNRINNQQKKYSHKRVTCLGSLMLVPCGSEFIRPLEKSAWFVGLNSLRGFRAAVPSTLSSRSLRRADRRNCSKLGVDTCNKEARFTVSPGARGFLQQFWTVWEMYSGLEPTILTRGDYDPYAMALLRSAGDRH
jgi:hypothetical protein